MIALALSPTAKAASERSLIRAHGSLFYGYNVWVVLALLNSGCSGFLVGAAFKHIDNVAVIVADVLATLLTAALSAAFFGARLTAALAVLEPCSTGVGGDFFALRYDSRARRVEAINGSGRAPAALTAARARRDLGLPADYDGPFPDAAKFHENATLVSLCAPRPEQRKLAARALRALNQPLHPGVVRAVEAERGRAAVVDGAGMVID